MAVKRHLQKLPGYAVMRKFYRRLQLKNKPAEQVFLQIYAHNIWGNAETVSGDGSTKYATEILRTGLTATLKNLGIQSMLDIPCGDFNWMKEMDLQGIRYIGADIVKELITLNQKNYHQPGIEFRHLNILTDVLPAVDLIFCKDCLVHFNTDDLKKALDNMVNTPAMYVACTTFPTIQQNKNIITGEWRPLNLEKPPVCFPPPLYLLPETADAYKCLGIWEMEVLKKITLT